MLDFAPDQSSWTFFEVAMMQFRETRVQTTALYI
jgi:hypothetical protein